MYSSSNRTHSAIVQFDALGIPIRGPSIYYVRTRVGRGSPKSRQKEQNQLIYVRDMGRGAGGF